MVDNRSDLPHSAPVEKTTMKEETEYPHHFASQQLPS
jgi:hypothetical protein